MEIEGQTATVVEVEGGTAVSKVPASLWTRTWKVLATYVVIGLLHWAYLESIYAFLHVSLDAGVIWFGSVGLIVMATLMQAFVYCRLDSDQLHQKCTSLLFAIPLMALFMTSSTLTARLYSCIESQSIRSLPVVHDPANIGDVLRNDIGARLTLDPARLQNFTGQSNAFTSMFYRVTVLDRNASDVLFGELIPSLQTPLPIQPDGQLWLSLAPSNWSIGLNFAITDLQRHYPDLYLSASPFVLSTNDLLARMQSQERDCRSTWHAMKISLPILIAAVILTDLMFCFRRRKFEFR